MLLSLSSKTTLLCLQVDENFVFFVLVYFCLTRVNAGQPLRKFLLPDCFCFIVIIVYGWTEGPLV